LGDFVRSPLPDYFSPTIDAGSRCTTRSTPIPFTRRLQVGQRRISAQRRRFSASCVVFLRHFLAIHWADYSPIPLARSASRLRGAAIQAAILPPSLAHMAVYMIRDDWLGSYATLPGIARAVGRIAYRFKGVAHIPTAVEELEQNYAGLDADFQIFFPDLVAYVQHEITANRENTVNLTARWRKKNRPCPSLAQGRL